MCASMVRLKQEVREKIWRSWIGILDRKKADESKKEEEEEKRLAPGLFNFGQRYQGESNAPALFCYLDLIEEDYRMYGGIAWLRYDKQFRQRKAVRSSIHWDHKDISLWMRLMDAYRSSQPFHGAAVGLASAGPSAASRRDFCWRFNEGVCKFSSDCKYKHVCTGCGGAHSLSKCFQRGQGKGSEALQKRGDASEGGRDGAVSRKVPI